MKTKLFIILGVLLVVGHQETWSQGFKPPSPGNAVIYFARPTSYGYAVAFQYFDNNKFIGEYKGKKYFRYECSPGHHLFWAKSENDEFLEADLKEGETYIVKIDVIIGTWKAHVGFTPISYSDKTRFDDCRELIMKKGPEQPDVASLEKMNKKLAKTINKTVADYNSKDKSVKKFRVLTVDMAIPPEGLK
ncbi:MAG: hypothetical protein NTU98_02040 [Bacteroidetes bacterium]|nr:hypothetical protein [Bacteroidota bacterium]